MYSKFLGLKFFVLIYFLVILLVFVDAQRLAVQRREFIQPNRLFNRLLSPLRNLVGEITSRQLRHFDVNLVPPETFLSTPEIIRFHGYPVEEHKVRTNDGYIISIFRITHNKTDDDRKNNVEPKDPRKLEPVLIQHGLICSSTDFLQLDSKDILPYLLADSVHNVWLGNVRGSTYGKQHADNISANNPKFYDFTMDEAAHDMSDIIKYILDVENEPQLSYVCHSMGCALISMAVSENPRLNKVIKKASFMAPGVYVSHLTSLALRAFLAPPQSFLLTFSQRYARGRLIPMDMSLAIAKYVPGICARENSRHLCNTAMFFLNGLNPGQIKNETLIKFSGHFPADTSMKLFTHYYQYAKSGIFQKYDYGMEKNLELYGSASPPLYNLSRVTFPVQGVFGLNDILTPPQDALKTFSELGNLVETVEVEDENWTHFDFLYGKDAKKQVYEKILGFLSSEK